MKKQIKTFFDLYLQSDIWDLGVLKKIILEDNNNYYLESSDIQLLDLSFEYDYKKKIILDNIRFSYFWTNINFLNKLEEKKLIKNIKEYKEKYYFYKDILKDSLLTYSFILENNILKSIKFYFDIDISKKEKLSSIEKKLTEKIVLTAFSFKDDKFREEKYYYELNTYIYYYSSLYLKNNKSFEEYRKNIPFEVLFRKNNLWKLISIKYYYKKNNKNYKLFEKANNLFKKKIEENDLLNLKEEVWIDFNLNWWINKLDYYIWLYK